MHHKRKRPKHQRAGCLMCKAQKDERRPRYGKRVGGWKRPVAPPRVAIAREVVENANG